MSKCLSEWGFWIRPEVHVCQDVEVCLGWSLAAAPYGGEALARLVEVLHLWLHATGTFFGTFSGTHSTKTSIKDNIPGRGGGALCKKWKYRMHYSPVSGMELQGWKRSTRVLVLVLQWLMLTFSWPKIQGVVICKIRQWLKKINLWLVMGVHVIPLFSSVYMC